MKKVLVFTLFVGLLPSIGHATDFTENELQALGEILDQSSYKQTEVKTEDELKDSQPSHKKEQDTGVSVEPQQESPPTAIDIFRRIGQEKEDLKQPDLREHNRKIVEYQRQIHILFKKTGYKTGGTQ